MLHLQLFSITGMLFVILIYYLEIKLFCDVTKDPTPSPPTASPTDAPTAAPTPPTFAPTQAPTDSCGNAFANFAKDNNRILGGVEVSWNSNEASHSVSFLVESTYQRFTFHYCFCSFIKNKVWKFQYFFGCIAQYNVFDLINGFCLVKQRQVASKIGLRSDSMTRRQCRARGQWFTNHLNFRWLMTLRVVGWLQLLVQLHIWICHILFIVIFILVFRKRITIVFNIFKLISLNGHMFCICSEQWWAVICLCFSRWFWHQIPVHLRFRFNAIYTKTKSVRFKKNELFKSSNFEFLFCRHLYPMRAAGSSGLDPLGVVEDFYLVVASGSSNQLAYHGDRKGAISISLDAFTTWQWRSKT